MCASLNKANERNLADNLLTWIRRLKITSGDHTGELVTVLPWQERFIRGTFRPGVQTSGLSIARGQRENDSRFMAGGGGAIRSPLSPEC